MSYSNVHFKGENIERKYGYGMRYPQFTSIQFILYEVIWIIRSKAVYSFWLLIHNCPMYFRNILWEYFFTLKLVHISLTKDKR